MSRTILHKHHIIPKHAGGTDDPSNLIYLTVEDHAEAHRSLFEHHGRWQDKLAWLALSGHVGKEEINRIKSSEGAKLQWQDEEHRKKISRKMKETMTGRDPWNKGKTDVYSEETVKAMSESAKGNTKRRGAIVSAESRQKMREAKLRNPPRHLVGRTIPAEVRQKMSIAARNRKKKTVVSE